MTDSLSFHSYEEAVAYADRNGIATTFETSAQVRNPDGSTTDYQVTNDNITRVGVSALIVDPDRTTAQAVEVAPITPEPAVVTPQGTEPPAPPQ